MLFFVMYYFFLICENCVLSMTGTVSLLTHGKAKMILFLGQREYMASRFSLANVFVSYVAMKYVACYDTNTFRIKLRTVV